MDRFKNITDDITGQCKSKIHSLKVKLATLESRSMLNNSQIEKVKNELCETEEAIERMNGILDGLSSFNSLL